jgi:hypothetical protein
VRFPPSAVRRRSPRHPFRHRSVSVAVLAAAVAALGLAAPVGSAPAGPAAPARPQASAAPAGSEYTLWGGATGRVEPGRARTFGTRFRVTRDGDATAIRVLAPDRGKRVGRIFNARGKVLGQVRFTRAAAGSWQTGTLTRPVRLHTGRSYVVAYTSRTGLHSVGGRLPTRTGSLKASAGLVGRTGMPRKATSTAQLVDVVYRPRVGPWPDAGNTGAPVETGLPAYDGPCTITRDGTVIDGRLVSCSLEIRASGVVVSNSVVHGTISSGSETDTDHSFTLLRSTLDVSPTGVAMETGVGEVNFKVIESEVRGGNRGINCAYRCTVRASWVHGQDTDQTGVWHESGIRMGERSKIIGNSIGCDAPDVPPDAGCSAPLTGYGDFAPVRHNTIDGNLFLATTGGTCAYGGSSQDKPYSNEAGEIMFVNNVFQRGESGNCGFWSPVMDFDRRAPGNAWLGNVWADGGAVSP